MAEWGAALFIQGEKLGDLIASDFEIEFGDFGAELLLADDLPGAAGTDGDAAARGGDLGAQRDNVGGCDIFLRAADERGYQRDAEGHADLGVVGRETVEKLVVVIEAGKAAILGDEVEGGEARRIVAAEFEGFGLQLGV